MSCQAQFNFRCLALLGPVLNRLGTVTKRDGNFQIEAQGILDEPQNVQYIALARRVGTDQHRQPIQFNGHVSHAAKVTSPHLGNLKWLDILRILHEVLPAVGHHHSYGRVPNGLVAPATGPAVPANPTFAHPGLNKLKTILCPVGLVALYPGTGARTIAGQHYSGKM